VRCVTRAGVGSLNVDDGDPVREADPLKDAPHAPMFSPPLSPFSPSIVDAMRSPSLVVLLVSAPVFLLDAQATRAPSHPAVAPTIVAIRQAYARINAGLPACKKHEDDLSGFSTEGGVLRSYRCGPDITKIEVWYYGESRRYHEEHYRPAGELAFVYTEDELYDRPIGSDQRVTRVVRRVEERFYFARGQLVQWMDSSRTLVPIASERAHTRGREILHSAAEALRRANGDTTAMVPPNR
jgi:hypothetical protein